MAEPFEIVEKREDQCLVFGYANVSVTSDGRLLTDLQNDQIAPDELEKAAYAHVLEFREADEMHNGRAIGQLVESMVFTPEKLEKLGLPKDAIQPRWWVGYKLTPAAFAKVKSGARLMFSIGGEAERT